MVVVVVVMVGGSGAPFLDTGTNDPLLLVNSSRCTSDPVKYTKVGPPVQGT